MNVMTEHILAASREIGINGNDNATVNTDNGGQVWGREDNNRSDNNSPWNQGW